MSQSIITRFAPSPSGDLHVGHAYSAWLIEQFVQSNRALGLAVAEPLLRWEDIDHTRCSVESEQSIIEDLEWLGFSYNQSQPCLRQSERLAIYAQALEALKDQGVVYPCFCTRKEIKQALEEYDNAQAQEVDSILNAPHTLHREAYPGTCKHLSEEQRRELLASDKAYSWRIDSKKIREQLENQGLELSFNDLTQDDVTAVNWDLIEDTVIARKDVATSYHLAVIIDDDAQGVTHAIRGEDLRETTHLHRVLQELLNLSTPTYIHHPLLYNDAGKRLSKRDQSTTIKQLKSQYATAAELLQAQLLKYQQNWQSLTSICKQSITG